MEVIYSRLKYARKLLQLKQSEIEEKTGIRQKDISRLESGTAQFIPEEYILFLYKSGININWVYSGEEPQLRADLKISQALPPDHKEENRLQGILNYSGEHEESSSLVADSEEDYKKKNDLYYEKLRDALDARIQILVATQDSSGNVVVPFIDYKATEEYLLNYKSPGYFQSLKSMSFPPYWLKEGQHYWLQVRGEAMAPVLKDGSWVLCRVLKPSQWEEARTNHIYVTVSKSHGISINRINNHLKDLHLIRGLADNTGYPPFEILLKDIIQIWEVIWHLNNNFSGEGGLILDKLNRMGKDIQDLKDAIVNKQ